MAQAPTPRFSQDNSQPVVIQNKMPKAGETDFTGQLGSGGASNSTFRLVGNQSGNQANLGSTTTQPTYPAGYTSGMPFGWDTVSGPGASYQPNSSNPPGQGTDPGTGDSPANPTGKQGPDSWRNPNLSPSPTRTTSGLSKNYTAPANNPGTYDPNDIGRGIGWGQTGGWDPNTPSPGTTGKGPGGFAPRDGGGDMRTSAANYSMTSVGNPAGMPTYGSTARNGSTGNRNGGGGSPYLGPPGLGGGGPQQQTGGMTRPTDPSQFTPEQQARYGNMLGRIGYYHPGTGLSTAGSPYANPGYGNPAGIWTPGYQAPSWMGGGYRGGTWDPNDSPMGGGARPPGGGPPPWAPGTPKGGGGTEPPTRDPFMAGGMDYAVRKDIRNMDSGSGPTGSPTGSGGGGGGGWVTVGMAPGMSSSRLASNDPRFAGRTAATGYTSGIPQGTDTISGPGAGSPYLGPPQGGPPPGGNIPPYPTIDWRNPPSPEQLLQMVRDWWKQWQDANPGGGPGPRFPGMDPTGATGVSSPYAPGAWGRMQEIWPPGQGGVNLGPAPFEDTDPTNPLGGDRLKSQRPGSGPRR